jgi:hypothetical protein
VWGKCACVYLFGFGGMEWGKSGAESAVKRDLNTIVSIEWERMFEGTKLLG